MTSISDLIYLEILGNLKVCRRKNILINNYQFNIIFQKIFKF